MSDSPERSSLSGLARSIDALFSSTAPRGSASQASGSTVRGSPAPDVDASSAVSAPVTDVPAAGTPIEAEPQSDEPPLAAEAFPASQMLDAISPAPAWTEKETTPDPLPFASGPEPMPESLLTFESHFETSEDESVDLGGRLDVRVDADLADEAEGPDVPIDSKLSDPIEAADVLADTELADAAHLAPTIEAVDPPGDAGPPASASGAWSDVATAGAVGTTPEEELLEAVDAYVGGDLAARDRIESAASKLRERLALDPLADAVEKLVRTAGVPPRREHLQVAEAVMNPAVASRLVQRMGRERDEERREEYQALCRKLGRPMANSLKGALTGALDPAVRRVYRETMIAMGEDSRPVIEAMVGDENRFLVADAVAMLGDIGGPRAVELVTSALADTDPRVRREALHALARLGDAEAGRLALGFLEDSDANVRVAAAVAAGELKLERALRPILGLLENESNAGRRAQLLEALGALGDPGAVPAIEKHAAPARFAKGSAEVRIAAYRALRRIGTPHARELVRAAAGDRDPSVRAALRGVVQEN